MSLVVRAYHGLQGLRQLEGPWRVLVSGMNARAYYHDFDWFFSYCCHAYADGKDQALRHFTVEDAGRLIAIVPLEHLVAPIRRVPTRLWALVGSRGGNMFMMSAAADFPAKDAAEGALALGAVRDYLLTYSPHAGLLFIGRVLESGAAGRSCASLVRHGVHSYVRGGFDVIPTDRTFDSLLAGLGGKFRRNLRSRRQRLEREGPLSVEVVTHASPEFPGAFRQLIEVEGSGWKGNEGSGTSISHNTRQRAFIDSLNKTCREVQPEIYLLKLGGRCIAAQYWLRANHVVVNLKMGYDESLARFSPGHQLLAIVLERACSDLTVREVNLSSHQPWHADWNPEFRVHLWHYFRLGRLRSLVPSLLLALPSRRAK